MADHIHTWWHISPLFKILIESLICETRVYLSIWVRVRVQTPMRVH